ncbi:MAG: copper ion binding protein, partial [Dehalococcoidia bacterium]
MADESNAQQQKNRVVIPVTGMTCASCVAHVTEALEEVPGVAEAQVNLASGQASVDYDPARTALPDLERAIRDTGYGVGRDTALLHITGMTCASCVEKIQTAVGDLPGVSKIAVNLASGTGRVEYLSAVTGIKEIRRAVQDLDYGVEEKLEGEAALDRERQERQREIRRQLINLAISWPLASMVMLGMLQPMWFFPRFVPEFFENKWF